MENEKLKNEFILKESESGKIISELSFKEFKVIGIDNQLYIFKIFKEEAYIAFHIKEIGDIQNIFYKKGLTIEGFCDLNILFKYLSIEEIYDLLLESFRYSGIKIIKKENKINLNFIFEVMGKKDDISLILESEKSKIDFEIIKLNEKIKEMELSNKKIKEEFEEYKKIMEEKINIILKNEIVKALKENEKKIKNLENELIEKENYINKLKNDIGIIRNDFTNLIDKGKISSNIINFGDLYLIEEGIQKNLNKKIKKFELIFRDSLQRTVDYSEFYRRCSNKSFYMIILVLTKEGNRLGGFIDIPSGIIKKTTNSFCFSFDKQKLIYNTRHGIYTTGCYFINGFNVGFNEYEIKNCICDNPLDFGFENEKLFDLEAYRIYLE